MTRRIPNLHILALACFSALGTERAVEADTVYLKNGSFINGVVISRDESVILRIGNLGQLEIPKDEVHKIERNSLTGAEGGVTVEDRDKESKAPDLKKGDGSEDGEHRESEADSSSDSGSPAGTEKAGSRGELADSSKESRKSRPEEEEKLDPKLEKEIRDQVQALQGTNPKHRIRAETRLRNIGSAAVPLLLPLLRHDSELVRIAAARLLSEMGDERAIDEPITALLDGNEYVRDYSNKALEHITREDFGYRPSASPRRREASRTKWLKWWERQKAEREKERERELGEGSGAGSSAAVESNESAAEGNESVD